MIRRFISENTDLILILLLAFFVCTKLIMINAFPGKHKTALFFTSLGFRGQAKLRNLSSKRKQQYLRKSNKINLVVYIAIVVLLILYMLMRSV